MHKQPLFADNFFKLLIPLRQNMNIFLKSSPNKNNFVKIWFFFLVNFNNSDSFIFSIIKFKVFFFHHIRIFRDFYLTF